MGQINSVHEGPVFKASVGHVKLGLTAAYRGPVELEGPGPKESGRVRRARAKAALRQRRDEVKRGAPFLERLTTSRTRERGNG